MLDYAVRLAPWYRRPREVVRRLTRLAISVLVCCVALAGAAVARYRPWYWYGSRAAYQCHRDLTFTLPADTVVYEEDPTRAAALFKRRDDVQFHYVGDAGDIDWKCRTLYGEYVSPAPGPKGPRAGFTPEFFRWRMGNGCSLVLLHGRTSPNGRERLTCTLVRNARSIEPQPPFRLSRSGLAILAFSCPAEQPISLSHMRRIAELDVPLTEDQIARLYAGQTDPKDRSHFTIKYEVDGTAGTIDGWLQDDDTVKLQVRDGPAAASRAATSAPSPGR